MPYFNVKLAKSELATQHSESRATKYIRKISLLVAGVVIGVSGMLEAKNAYSAEEQSFPLLVYRTGPYAPSGIPVANGVRDYYDMLNKRDGGINGVKLTWEECETKYNTKTGVECYEKLKNKGKTAVINPFSTGITYQGFLKSTAT